MTDQLPFPPPDDLDDPFAAEIAARLRASYAALPSTPPSRIDGAVQSVLAAARAEGQSAVPIVQSGSTGAATGPAWRGGPRWWWGAAAAAVLVAVVMRPWHPEATRRAADSSFAAGAASLLPSGSTREESGGTVRFEFRLPTQVRQVALVGDFNGWDDRATPMVRRNGEGTWSARIPLSPGRHEYAFVVDGTRWLVDPLAPQVTDAGFGPTNAVIVDGTVSAVPSGDGAKR